MNKARLILNKIMKSKFYVGFFFLGIVFIIAGIVVMNLQNKATVSASATILDIDYELDSTDNYYYTVVLEYKDESGTDHTVTTHSYSSGWKEGDVISIKYNPSNYDDISFNDTAFLPYLVIIVGGLVVVFSLVKFVLIARKKTDDDNEFNKVSMDNVSEDMVKEIENSTEPKEAYVFHYTQGLKTSYIMKDSNQNLIMEAQNQNLSIVTSYKFNFINHLSGAEEMKTCSHTVTTEYEEGSISMPTSSSFDINGEKCWKVLGKTGYSLEPHLNGLHMSYDVLKYGVPVAYFENAGTNEATGKDYKLGEIAAPGIYKISCRKNDIEGVFLACFIVARTYDL